MGQKEQTEEKLRVMNVRLENAKGCNQYGHAPGCEHTGLRTEKQEKLQRELRERQSEKKSEEEAKVAKKEERKRKKTLKTEEGEEELAALRATAQALKAAGFDREFIWRKLGIDVGYTEEDKRKMRLLEAGVSEERFVELTGEMPALWLAAQKEITRQQERDLVTARPHGAEERIGRDMKKVEGVSMQRVRELLRCERAREIQAASGRAWVSCYNEVRKEEERRAGR